MYKIRIEAGLERILKKLYKKNRKLYDVAVKRIEQIVDTPWHFKPLRHNFGGLRRIHLESSFVLIFQIDEKSKTVVFLDLDHHDKVYRTRPR